MPLLVKFWSRKKQLVDYLAALLSHQDSNLGKQNQNLMCYHYTMGHEGRNSKRVFPLLKIACKSTLFSESGQIFFATRVPKRV